MALERFSVDDFLAQNGYKTKAFTGPDNTNPYLPVSTSGSSKNKTSDLDRFSVDGWLSKNGYESFNVDKYEAPYVEQKVDDALSFVGEQPQEDKSGSIGEIAKALVGSLGAGVVNMLRTADTSLSGAAKYINSSVMQGAYWLDEQVKGKEYIDEVAWGNKARAEALNPQNNGVAPALRDVENGIRKWADTQNEGWLTRAVAGAVESTPAMVASAVMPLVGSAMLFNQAFSNTLEGDIISAQQKNKPIDYNMLMTKAVASGAIELATEKLFNLFGGMKGAAGEILHGGNKGIVGTALATFNGFKKEFVKEGGDELAEFGVREFGKFMFKKAAEEGTEEIASTFLNGVVALGTTDAGKKLFWFQGDDAIIQWEEVRDSFVGGAIMGGAFGAWNYSNQAKAYKKAAPNTDAYLNEQQKKSLAEVGPENVSGLYDAMQRDVAENDLGTVAAQVSMESTAAVQQKIEDGTLRTEPVSYEELPQSTITATVAEPSGTVTVQVNQNETVNAKVEAVPISSIINSMDADGNTNANYPTEYQPRMTDRAGSLETISGIATNPKFPNLTRLESIQEGTPVLTSDGVTVAGNHRVAGFLQMMRDNPQAYESYKQYVRDNSAKLGVDPATLQGDFILSRMLPAGFDAVRIASDTNVSGVRHMAPIEKARQDAGNVTPELLSLFTESESGEVNTRDNATFISRFMNEVVPASEKSALMDKNGNLNQDGVNRVRNALFYKAYGSIALLDLIAESTDNNVKRLTNSLVNVAPKIVKHVSDVQNGVAYDVGLPNMIASAAEQWVRMKNAGQKVYMFAMQTELGDTADTIRAKNLLLAMEANIKSAKQLTEFYNHMINAVTDAGNPKAQTLFSMKDISIDDVIEVAMRKGDVRHAAQIELQLEDSGRTDKAGGTSGEVASQTQLAIQTAEAAIREIIAQPSANTQPTAKPESQTKSKSESFNEALENMANQEPSADVQGIVSPDFAAVMGDMKTSKFNSNGYNGVFDSDVRKRIDDSMSITHDKTIKEKIAQFKAFFTKSFLRGSVNIPYSYGELRQRIQSYRNANQSADTSIENYIMRIYNPVGKQNYKLMRDAVLMLDLKEDIIDKHLYEGDNAKPLPFGIKTVSDAMQMIADVEQQLKNPKNESVVKAVEARRNIMDIMRKQLIDTAGAVGWDLSYLEGRTNYMHHAIMEYVNDESKSKYKGGSKSSSYKGREGSYKDYVSDPALSDYLVMRKMMKDMMKIGVYNELKTLDIKDTLKVDADGRLIVPDGYAEFDRKQMGLSYMDKNGSPDDAAVQFMQSTADKLGIPSNVVDKVVEKAQSKKNDSVIVIPMDVRDAVAEEFEIKKSSNQAFNLQRMATQAWKRWQLESPRRFIKYNIKNLAGDTDAMLMIYPQTVKKVAQSFRELTDMYKNGKTTARLAEYAKFGGLSTSLATVELGDLQSLPNFTFYESEENVGKLAVNKMRRITQSIDKFTEWREQLLRYAAYLQQVEDLSKSKDGLPKNYGASKPAEIKSINTVEGRAFKLSNDALGAYNDVTPMAQGMSKTVYPFFRFKEVNMRRFFRLAQNAFYVDTDTTMSAGESVAAKLAGGAKVTGYAALRIGKIALGYAAFVGSLALWNRIAAPDEEDELPEDVRNTVHIVFPKWATGGELMYFSDLSSFYQLFNDIGFAGVGDVANDLKEIVNGKMTIGDKVKEIANSSASSFMNGMAPFFKPVMEAIVGKTIYPDISKPGTVRDPWEHIFKSVSLDNEYRALTGKALPGGSYLATWRKAFVSSIVPGEAALSDVYDMKERYYSSIGKTGFSGGTKDAKANAIYNYKVALKYGDTAAAERYLKQYALFGGTQATFEKSLAALDPTYGMSKDDKKKFIAGMSEQETETYNRAVEYFKSIQASGNPSTLPKK